MANELMLALPILVGLLGTGLAVYDRGYRDYITAKKNDPTITKFSPDYMTNVIISAGGVGAFFGAVVPLIMNIMTPLPTEGLFIWAFLQLWGGYSSAYTVLDKLNKPVEAQTALANFKRNIAEGNVKIEGSSQPVKETSFS